MTDIDDTDTAEPTEDGDFKVVRAQDLRGGNVVYLVAENDARQWTPEIARATVFHDGDIADALALAEKDVAADLVLGAEPVEITGKHEPVGAKETIRALGGPTVKYGEDALQPDYSI